MARDFTAAERHVAIRSFVKCGIALPITGSRDSEINIDGLPDYWMNKSADLEETKFFSTVAQKCHGNFNFITAISISPRQFQLCHGSFNFTTAISTSFTAISTLSRQFQFHHGNFNFTTTISILSRQFQLRSRQFQFQFHHRESTKVVKKK